MQSLMVSNNGFEHAIRAGYGEAAKRDGSSPELLGKLGYERAEIAAADGAVSLGCGNPGALAALKPGEVVVDLGSGAGFDALIAAPGLGSGGRFIGVDMTPEMLEKARTNAVNAGLARTVEFREGAIEELPIASESADVVISNCVINLSTDKARVFREAFRVLRSGGRLAVTDLVVTEQLPSFVSQSGASWAACVAGALTVDAYVEHLEGAGFVDAVVEARPVEGVVDLALQDPLMAKMAEVLGPAQTHVIASMVRSASITARKP
jgi:arsenite methyltransferase